MYKTYDINNDQQILDMKNFNFFPAQNWKSREFFKFRIF